MKRFLILGSVVAALAVGIIAVAGAAAQSEDETPAGHFLELLADNLGVTVEELEDALRQSHVDIVNEKVADGSLSEEEAAEIIERIESGEARLFPPFGPRHPGHHGHHHRLLGLIVQNSAEVLEMEVDALTAELREGNSLADVATAQGVDVETFKAELLAAIEADLDQKITDGEITQEKADRILEAITNNIDRIIEKVPGEGGGPHPGFPGFNGPLGGEGEIEATITTSLN